MDQDPTEVAVFVFERRKSCMALADENGFTKFVQQIKDARGLLPGRIGLPNFGYLQPWVFLFVTEPRG